VKYEKEFPKGADMKPPRGLFVPMEAFDSWSSINPNRFYRKGGWGIMVKKMFFMLICFTKTTFV